MGFPLARVSDLRRRCTTGRRRENVAALERTHRVAKNRRAPAERGYTQLAAASSPSRASAAHPCRSVGARAYPVLVIFERLTPDYVERHHRRRFDRRRRYFLDIGAKRGELLEGRREAIQNFHGQ